MLRTNLSFLSFTEALYEKHPHSEDIVLTTFSKGELLLHQDGKASKVFILKEGIIKCFFREENGKDYILEFMSEGEIVGEIEVIKNSNCLCNVEAITAVKAYAIPVALFRNLLEQDANFNRLILEELAERIINTSSRASSQQLYTIEYGLRKILELQAKQDIIISKEDIAAYLGITTRSLNRALKEL